MVFLYSFASWAAVVALIITVVLARIARHYHSELSWLFIRWMPVVQVGLWAILLGWITITVHIGASSFTVLLWLLAVVSLNATGLAAVVEEFVRPTNTPQPS